MKNPRSPPQQQQQQEQKSGVAHWAFVKAKNELRIRTNLKIYDVLKLIKNQQLWLFVLRINQFLSSVRNDGDFYMYRILTKDALISQFWPEPGWNSGASPKLTTKK